MRRIRIIASVAIVALLAPLATAAPVNALIVLPQRTLHFSTHVTGTAKPYALSLDARLSGSTANVQVNLTRKEGSGTNATQQHSWYVQNVAFSCTNGVQRCELDTGTHMGPFGRIHLVFNGTGQPKTVEHGCPNDLHEVNTQTTRSGTVTGSFRLVTGTAYFGTIRNTPSAAVHIPASITGKGTKFSYAGECESSSGPCTSQLFSSVPAGALGAVSAYQFTAAGWGSALWNVDDPPITADVTLVHRVYGSTHATVVKTTSNTPSALATIHVKLPFGPFLTGHATFSGSGSPTRTSYPGCRETDRSGSSTGTFKVKLDGYGPYAWTGTVSANASRFVSH